MTTPNPIPTQPETLEPPEVIHVTFCSKCGRTGLHNTRCSKCGNKLGFEDEIAYLRQLEQLSPELVERVANYLEGNRHDNPLVLAHALRRAAVTAPRGDVATTARNRDVAQRVVMSTEGVLGERFDIATRHELADRITAALDAVTSSPTPAEPRICVKCGHSNFNRVQGECDEPDSENIFCGCKCEFAPAERTRVEGEQSYSEGFDDAARVARVLSNVATSGSARRAAEEWFTLERQQMYKIFNIDHPAQIPPYLQRQREKYVAELAAIISKYFATAPC